LEAGRHTSSGIDLEQHETACSGFNSTLQDCKRDVNLLKQVVFRRHQPESSLYVIQELFRSKQESQTLAQFYADFNNLSEEVKEFFAITANVKEMQER